MSPARAKASRSRSLLAFIADVYAPGLHLAFAAAWYAALTGGLALLSDQHRWRPDLSLILGAALFFVVLFYLRVMDEWKDLAYDRLHNPDRPLVRGVVRLQDLFVFLGGSAAIALLLQWLSPARGGQALALLVADLGYGLLLVAIERSVPFLRDQMIANLLITYPVNVALSFYVYAAFVQTGGRIAPAKALALIAAFACAFLHYEFGRKISWPHHAPAGRRLYSAALGIVPSTLLCVAFALAALGLSAWLFAATAWAPLLAIGLVPVVLSVLRLLQARHLLQPPRPSAPMTGTAMLFLVCFYTSMILLALHSAFE